jgi:hypothetical protein
MIGIWTVVLVALLFWATFYFRKITWEPLGLAFWPRLVLGGMFLVALFLLIKGDVAPGTSKPINIKAFVPWLAAVSYIVVMQYLGFLITTPLFLFLSVLAFGGWKRRIIKEAILTAIITTAVVYLAFQKFLDVLLPEGILE